jgi:TetR/AcrR family transcriptional regulator, cholesterol catabolism regulator
MQFGIRNVTMDQIAVGVGASKKTIYQYFADKDALVDEVVKNKVNQAEQSCCRDIAKAKDAIHEIILAIEMMQHMFKNTNTLVFFELEKYYPKSFEIINKHKVVFLYKILKENLLRGIEQGVFRSEVNVEIIVRSRLETIMLPFNIAVYSRDKFDLVKVETELALHYMFGLATLKGHKLIEKYLKLLN